MTTVAPARRGFSLRGIFSRPEKPYIHPYLGGALLGVVLFLAFLLGWASHLLLDTLVGHIWWLYPLAEQSFSLAEVENRFQPWWMNFILHWTMLFELAIIAVATWVETRSPLIFTRLRLAKPVAGVGILFAALLLTETYRPAPALAQQPVAGFLDDRAEQHHRDVLVRREAPPALRAVALPQGLALPLDLRGELRLAGGQRGEGVHRQQTQGGVPLRPQRTE